MWGLVKYGVWLVKVTFWFVVLQMLGGRKHEHELIILIAIMMSVISRC
jgi:hypothetical protein